MNRYLNLLSGAIIIHVEIKANGREGERANGREGERVKRRMGEMASLRQQERGTSPLGNEG